MENDKIIRRHIHSVLFASFFRWAKECHGIQYKTSGSFFCKNGNNLSGADLLKEYIYAFPVLYHVRYDLFLMPELQYAFDNLYFDQEVKSPNFRYDDETQTYLEGVTDSSRKSAIESWLSSPFAMLDTISRNISTRGGDDELFLHENNTLMHLGQKEREYLLMPIAGGLAKFDSNADFKSIKLIEIITEHCVRRKSKVIVFVNRHITAIYLSGVLEQSFREVLMCLHL